MNYTIINMSTFSLWHVYSFYFSQNLYLPNMATELTVFLDINTNIDFLLMIVSFVLAKYSQNKTILGINLKAVQLLVVYRNYFPIQKPFVCCYHGL